MSDTPEILAARILEIEHRIYPEALRLLAQRAVFASKAISAESADGAAAPGGPDFADCGLTLKQIPRQRPGVHHDRLRGS